jgi:hypothetical protein
MGEIKLPKTKKDVLKIRLRHYIVFYRVVLGIGRDNDQVRVLSAEEMAEADKYHRELVLTNKLLLFWVYAGYREAIHRYIPGLLGKYSALLEPPESLRGWWSTAEFMSAY